MAAWQEYFLLVAFGFLYDDTFSVVLSNSKIKKIIKNKMLSALWQNTVIIVKVDICHCNT